MLADKQQTDNAVFSRARRSRDSRFDGVFFTAVKTTRIFCRPICPAAPAKEGNVEYFSNATSAAQAGYRPCLRCHPDSAPGLGLWQGTDVTFKRAIELIHQGVLQDNGLEHLATRLGISARYLRKLFQEKLGMSPKRYAIYHQCLLAKKLLHETQLPMMEVAFASGFNSVRRFNEAMQERLAISPSQIRKQTSQQGASIKPSKSNRAVDSTAIRLTLSYQPPFAWREMHDFLQRRLIDGVEWCDGEGYGRTIYTDRGAQGYFYIRPLLERNALELLIVLDDLADLYMALQRIKQIFDIDAPMQNIDQHLSSLIDHAISYQPGLRIPGIWSEFETGVRAILGQQVSVKQAHTLVTKLVESLGERVRFDGTPAQCFFPTAQAVANSDLDFFKMPQSRKDTLRRFAAHFLDKQAWGNDNTDALLDLKGIGPWTLNYIKLRSNKDPDVWLEGDAGVKNALKQLDQTLDIEKTKPWRSYVVFQLWNQL